MKIIALYFGLLFTTIGICQNSYEDGLTFCTIKVTLLNEKERNRENMGPVCMVRYKLPKMKAYSTLSGKIISDVYFKGKITVINFWFEGCPPCEAEIPGLNALVDKYGSKVNFLAIGRNNKVDITNYLKNHPWKFDHISGEKLINDVFKLRWGFPTTFVVDENMIIHAAFSGGRTDHLAPQEIQDRLIPIIEQLLKK
jgi:thiol-disulfide isomerase/thioredoxin